MVSFQGVLCWAGNAEPSLCPRVSYGNDWHCINSIPCVMEPVEAIVTTPTPDNILVTFKVGMQDQAVSPAGVHVAGSFQDWDPAATELLDSDQDGVYEVTLALPPGFYEFKFINGDSWDDVEYVPLECQEAGSGPLEQVSFRQQRLLRHNGTRLLRRLRTLCTHPTDKHNAAINCNSDLPDTCYGCQHHLDTKYSEASLCPCGWGSWPGLPWQQYNRQSSRALHRLLGREPLRL